MALLYTEGRFAETPVYADATENIPEGSLVTATSNGMELADAADHSHVGGIVLNLEAGDHIADHQYDYQPGIDQFVYKPAANKTNDDMLPDVDDRPPLSGRIDGSRLWPKTVSESTSGVTTAPSISHMGVVGVVDTSDSNAPSGAGVIVEEGYTNDEDNDGTSTTFSRSNGNFIPVGRAVLADDDFPVTSFDTRVWVERDKSL